MSIKYVSTNVGFVLHETCYTSDRDNIYSKYANSRNPKHSLKLGKTDKLMTKCRKTEPRGKVFNRLIQLKINKVLKDDA